MANELFLEIMKQAYLFSGLDNSQRRRIALRALVRKFPEGAEVFAMGDRASGFYLVVQGAVKVFRLSPEGREHILHFCRPPDLIAESAVFADGVFPAAAAAIEPSTLALFPRAEIIDAIKRDSDLALAMIAGMSRRLREFVNVIDDLSLKDVTARLAGYLLQHARGGVCELPGSKAQLASHIGTVAEPLSRALRKLKSLGLIEERSGQTIAIADEEGLRALYEGIEN